METVALSSDVRKCTKCGMEKPLTGFFKRSTPPFKLDSWCKVCSNENTKKWAKAHPERVRELSKDRGAKYRGIAPEKFREACRKWRKKNRDSVREYNQQWRKENPEYKKDNAASIVKSQSKWRMKQSKNPKFILDKRIATGVYLSLKGNKKGRAWERLLGYSVDDLKQHLEKQFKTGMTWYNMGQWEIDHIIPLSAFNFDSPEHIDFKRAWALKNLQPLWAGENSSKKNKLSKPFQPTLKLSMATDSA